MGEDAMLMVTTLLICHGLLAVFMLGALTHQSLALWWPAKAPAGQRNLFDSFRSVRAAHYTNTIIVLFVITAIGGALLYPTYRLAVRVVLEDLHRNAANGIFELKEHFIAIGLGVLPVYWYYWQPPLTENVATRKILTLMLTLIVWWAFLVGHILNNIRGFGS
jgi:hypothetical protein